jgi:hypothetical protein
MSKKQNVKVQRDLSRLENIKVKIIREIDLANGQVCNFLEHGKHQDAIVANAEALAFMSCLLMVEEEIANSRKP